MAIELDGHYERLAERGYRYGPAFELLHAAWRDGADILAEVALPASARDEASSYELHPTLLDAALHGTERGTVVAWLRQAGDVFGELAVIDFLPRSANAVALVPTSCLAMDAACFDALPPADQAVIYAILYKSLAQVVTTSIVTSSRGRRCAEPKSFAQAG